MVVVVRSLQAGLPKLAEVVSVYPAAKHRISLLRWKVSPSKLNSRSSRVVNVAAIRKKRVRKLHGKLSFALEPGGKYP